MIGIIEIERKFLCVITSKNIFLKYPSKLITQGYLQVGVEEERIRKKGNQYLHATKVGFGISRVEREREVSDADGEALFLKARDRLIEKERYCIGKWEIDKYIGKLAGLVVLEVELTSENEKIPEIPEGIQILKEVTTNELYKNQKLACLSFEDATKFVYSAYNENPLDSAI